MPHFSQAIKQERQFFLAWKAIQKAACLQPVHWMVLYGILIQRKRKYFGFFLSSLDDISFQNLFLTDR